MHTTFDFYFLVCTRASKHLMISYLHHIVVKHLCNNQVLRSIVDGEDRCRQKNWQTAYMTNNGDLHVHFPVLDR